MNNRGFAITTILYGMLIIFCLLLVSMLGILSVYKGNVEKLLDNTNGARDIINRDYSANYVVLNGSNIIGQYQTLVEANNALANNYTIRVLNNVTESSAVTISKNNILLDLNGKTITLNGVVLTNTGELDITSIGGEGILRGTALNVIVNNGELSVYGDGSYTVSIINTSDNKKTEEKT